MTDGGKDPASTDPGHKADADARYVALVHAMAGLSPGGEDTARAVPGAKGEDFWQAAQEFIDAIPTLVMLVDEAHQIVLSNSALQRYLGLAADEMADRYCHRVVHDLDDPYPGCPLDDALRETGHWVEKELVNEATGIWVSAAIYPTPWRTSLGKKIFIHTVHDITARKTAQENLRKTLEGTIEVLTAVTEVRDPYTADHARRVAVLARAVAGEMGFTGDEEEGTYVAALLHDIGKLYVPVELLNKSRPLTEVEMNLVKIHPQVAYDILKDLAFPWPVARIVLQHHERADGSGYPAGLTDMLPQARVLAVADVVEAMSSHRPYRPALGVDAALAEISRGKGTIYDPPVVDACLRVFAKGFTFGSPSG